MNYKRWLSGFATLGVVTAPVTAVIACSGDATEWKGHTPGTANTDLFSNLTIELKSQATLTNAMVDAYKKEAKTIEKALTDAWNKKYPNDQRNITVKIVTSEDTSTIAQRLDNGAIGAAFLTPSFFGEYAEGRKAGDKLAKARKFGIVPALITGRYPIIVGKDNNRVPIADKDSNTKPADLARITKFLNDTFMDQTGTRYNGLKYDDETKGLNFVGAVGAEQSVDEATKLYVSSGIDENTATANYRGVIIMAGNAAKRAAIKKAWDDKDWPAFRKHGLIFQKNTSVSGYQYSQMMLKEHFGKDAFRSIKQENLNHPTEVLTGQTGMMSRIGVKGAIGFTYFKDLVKNNKLYNTGKELRILTVTRPILTDGIGLSGKLSIKEREIFISTFKALIAAHPTWNLWKVYGAKYWKSEVNGKTPEEVGIELADSLSKGSL